MRIICAIPSGGIPVGVEIARELSFPFTVLVVRKTPDTLEYRGGIRVDDLGWKGIH